MDYSYLLNFAVLLLVIGLFILFGIPLFQRIGKKEPEPQRRWTDPAVREETRKRE